MKGNWCGEEKRNSKFGDLSVSSKGKDKAIKDE